MALRVTVAAAHIDEKQVWVVKTHFKLRGL
jgi:hypothetical protein